MYFFCCFVEIKKYPCGAFFNCLFTFTMECGAYSNNAPTQFQILKRKHHSKALIRSEKMHPARILRPKSTFAYSNNAMSSRSILRNSRFLHEPF
jgi:hypothetical protein